MRQMRKKLLKSIVDMIRAGEFEQQPSINLDQLYPLHKSVREEYQAPRDISGFNWGAERTWEMDAGMDEAF